MALINEKSMDFNGLELECAQLTATTSVTIGSETLVAADLTLLNGVTATAAELNYNDITTLGTGAASKAVVLNTGEDYTWPSTGVLTYGVLKDSAATTITATGAEINYLDIASLGTGAASKAVVLSSTGTYTGPTAATTKFTWSVTSNSTDGGTSVEPFVHNTTMTGAGGVGGRARFELDTNVALGSWANALKAQTEFGAAGSVTGLGSAFVAELTLSAGTASGNYAPLELELNLGTGALTGTASALVYASVNGLDAGTFDTNGFFLNLAGLTAGASNTFRTGLTAATINAATTAALRVKIGATTYFIPLATATA